MGNLSSVLVGARRHAAQAMLQIQEAKTAIQELTNLNKALRLTWRALLGAHYQLYTWIYVILLLIDSAISLPLVRLVTNEGQKLTNPLWDVVFFALYFVVVGAITMTVAEYFSLTYSRRHWNQQLDLRLLFDNKKRRPELELELQQEASRKYTIAVFLTVALVLFLSALCAYRVYVVNERVWAFRAVDFIQLLPVALALLLIFLGRYKGILLKRAQWSFKRRRLIKKYHLARAAADDLVDIVVDQLESAGIDLDDKSLPSEITQCVLYYRSKNPFELMEADSITDVPKSAAS